MSIRRELVNEDQRWLYDIARKTVGSGFADTHFPSRYVPVEREWKFSARPEPVREPLDRLADVYLAAMQNQGGVTGGGGDAVPYVVISPDGGGGVGMGTVLIIGALAAGAYMLYKRGA